ncbi:hypothetical protein H2203_005477 [Taxawa tesnikishii (nom. ined.)]|nr:hypothetical protein H2203_005477 [Dothideales sp. JES 119]
MSSPFQFTDELSTDPNSPFKIAWNGVLGKDDLTKHWYQILIVVLGCTALFLGAVTLAIQKIQRVRQASTGSWTDFGKTYFRILTTVLRRIRASHELLDEKDELRRRSDRMVLDLSQKLAGVKSLHVIGGNEPSFYLESASNGLHIVSISEDALEDISEPLTAGNPFLTPSGSAAQSIRDSVEQPLDSRFSTFSFLLDTPPTSRPVSRAGMRPESRGLSVGLDSRMSPRPASSRFHSREGSAAHQPLLLTGEENPSFFFGACDLTDGSFRASAVDNAADRAKHLSELRFSQGLDGLVLRYGSSDNAGFTNILLRKLRQLDVPVMLLGDAGSPLLEQLHFELIDGLILQNACLLPNGERRDFFRAATLRECAARAKTQRKTRPGFFLGFLELWDIRPSSATLRRAYKLADFYGAVIEARPRLVSADHKPRKGMPLSAFDFLKKADAVWLQKTWSTHVNFSLTSDDDEQAHHVEMDLLCDAIPSADRLLALYPLPDALSALKSDNPSTVESPDYISGAPRRSDLWSVSSCGSPLCPYGSFALREEITSEQYSQILNIQRCLRDRKMLQVFGDAENLRVTNSLKALVEISAHGDLLRLLLRDLAAGRVRIYKGLDSGFALPDKGGQVWGVSDRTDDGLDIFISLKNYNDAATIWHVFLAEHGVSRLERFEEECKLAPAQTDMFAAQLPMSLHKELEDSTEAELLYLLEQVRVSKSQHPFADAIRETCSRLLIEDTTRRTWNTLHSRACLDGSVDIRTLVQMRLEFFARMGAHELPEIDNLIQLYEILEEKIEKSLFNSDRTTLKKITGAVLKAYGNAGEHSVVEPVTDLYALVLFCVLRRLAFEDIYLETTDRCPLFLSQPDQAGVFSELWVLGSQCEIYFGIYPRALGEITYERYREYLTHNPPPVESWNGKDVFSAYSNAEPRIKLESRDVLTGSGDPTDAPSRTPEARTAISFRKAAEDFGALSIFCFPAIIDVLLLAFLGRGLYLTSFMGEYGTMANYAILAALLMTGGITGWVGSTGGFYLFSFAFDNMTHFLVQRLSAALMLTSVVALCGFVAFGFEYSWLAAFVFVMYLFALSIFLNCITILFISPVLTTFVNGWDTLIYLLVIYVFIATLLFTFRNLCHEWTTWHTKVPAVKDKDLLAWYKQVNSGLTPNVDASSLAASARAALETALENRPSRNKLLALLQRGRPVDEFVEKMADGMPYALFLLEKESNGEELPERFTTTWFVQLELALANQRQLMRGLKEHSPFITYRYSRYDLAQNVGLFLGALMDRWITIAMSARKPEANFYSNATTRYALCFGLLYFLLGAVAVDIVLQRYWPYATMLSKERLTSLEDFARITQQGEALRRRRYRAALLELFTLLSIPFGITTILLWAFVIDSKSIILYFTYISSYTGALLFQFHRCFTKTPVLMSSRFSAAALLDSWLNTATLSAAVGTFIFTEYFPNPFEKTKSPKISDDAHVANTEKSVVLKGQLNHATCNNVHDTNATILRHACLDVDVNAHWGETPEDVRRLILNRVLGAPASATLIVKTWLHKHSKNVTQHDEHLMACLNEHKAGKLHFKESFNVGDEETSTPSSAELSSTVSHQLPSRSVLGRIVYNVVQWLDCVVKWTAVISGAAPDASRELWRIENIKGNRITVDTPLWKATGFISRGVNEPLGIAVYSDLHDKVPEGKRPIAIAFYDDRHRLNRRQDFLGPEDKPITTTYQYADNTSRWPISKITTETKGQLKTQFDKYGRPISGQIIRGDTAFDYEFSYKKGSHTAEDVLMATYTSANDDSHMSLTAFWCVKPRTGSNKIKHWTPSDKIQRVLATFKGKTYDLRWTYKHSRDIDVQASVLDDEEVMQDKYDFLKKPKHRSFDHEDLLIYHPTYCIQRLASPRSGSSLDPRQWFSSRSSKFSAALPHFGKKVVYRRLPTSTLRTALWSAWGKAPFVDAVSACFLDEMILRKEPLLRKYWHLRDAGFLLEAAHVLDENLEQIVSAIEPSHESSQTCPLLIKSADLYTMGLGKDANQVTARPDDCYRDTETTTSVIFSDNGCWPDNPGGVSNCRRDLVNGHTTIRGHCLAESANDFGIPRFQIERNINSLKVLPLWGLDGKTPYHGVIDNLLQTQVDERIDNTLVQEDIQETFIPLLRLFVKGARSKRYTREDLVTYTNVILKMSKYFEQCDFNKTWNSDQVWRAWIEAWLYDYNDPNINRPQDCFEIQQASMSDYRDALNLYVCYFFIYSVELPADCPTVFQSTHHGISSLYGMLLKYRRGATWGIWDHAILWRETCLNISPAQCLLPIPVQTMLLAGVRLACHLAYTHVDIVLPCTSVFNPDWEQDLGTDQGLRGSKKLFARKIDPIVNGIGNMDAFQPVKETKSKLPTTVMLSNVQFIKDVKTAVLAADIIINTYGFSDYRLVIYGAQDRQPSYALETTTLINTRGLAGKVILAGFGSPKEVLKDAWLFMNSSLSEGLPLAIGEAALSGVPIVATERYGEVVPPNDPEALARAQLSILGMLGPWTQYTKDPTQELALPDTFTPEDVVWVTKRMYEVADDRRALGLRLRDVVLRSFHGHRYLREHEQMYWIQRRRAEIRRSKRNRNQHSSANTIFGERALFEYDDSAETQQDTRPRWQDFDAKQLRRRKGRLQIRDVDHEKMQA